MKRLSVLLPSLALAFAQNSPQSGVAPGTSIRVNVNLVQVDAVITDSHGRRVADLQSGEFELLQDGKKQAITNFSYVSAKPDVVRRPFPSKPAKGEAPPPAPVLQPTEVRRALALVVDDLGLAAENIPRVRGTIRNFIDEQMRPGDVVALVRTGAGMGALQQFTTDKRLLYAALDRVKYGESRVGMSSFTPLGSGGGRAVAALNHLREDSLAVGSLGALRFVVNAMAGFPGRKSVVLFTENIRMIYRGATDEMVAQAVEQLSDAASRASVVIHAIDPRGMADFSVTAADDTSRMSSRRVSRVPAQRQAEMIHTEEGMFALAEETGGLFLHDANDLGGELRKAVEDGDGYYLIGYHPDAGTFEDAGGPPRFHRIEVRVTKPGLHVRSRQGFFGQPGSRNPTPEHTREAQLDGAMQSPYTGTIHPRLTAIFSNLKGTGSFLNAFLYFEPRELKWSSEPDGKRKARVDLAAATFDENGSALSTVDTTFSLLFNPHEYDVALQKGLVYSLHIPIAKPGPYLVRAALRDPATEGAGSAEQFVEVPDIQSGHLAMSGLVVQEAQPQTDPGAQHHTALTVDYTAGVARRTFRRGAELDYYYEIMNAGSGPGRHPELEVETRLFHDGEQVVAGKSAPDTSAGISDPQHLRGAGRLSLASNLAPGQYALQVIVTDRLAKGKFNTVSQSADFEIQP